MTRLRTLLRHLAFWCMLSLGGFLVIAGLSRFIYGCTYEELTYIGCDECVSELHERTDWFGPLQVSGSGPFRCSWIWDKSDFRILRPGLRVKLRDRPGCSIKDMMDKAEASVPQNASSIRCQQGHVMKEVRVAGYHAEDNWFDDGAHVSISCAPIDGGTP